METSMRRQHADKNNDFVSRRRALQSSVDEQAHARGEEAAQGVLRLVDRELERSDGYGNWLSEHDCDQLHLCALRGFLEGLRDDLIDTVGIDRAVTRRVASDVFGVEKFVGDAVSPVQQAIEDGYEALLGLGASGEPMSELSEHLGDYVIQLVSAAARHERGEELLLEGRLLGILIKRITMRMCELPEIGVACAHAALADASARFEQRLIDAARTANEESARVLGRVMSQGRSGDGVDSE